MEHLCGNERKGEVPGSREEEAGGLEVLRVNRLEVERRVKQVGGFSLKGVADCGERS